MGMLGFWGFICLVLYEIIFELSLNMPGRDCLYRSKKEEGGRGRVCLRSIELLDGNVEQLEITPKKK